MKKSLLLMGLVLIISCSAFCQRVLTEIEFFDDTVFGNNTEQNNYVGPGWVHGSHPIFFDGTLSYSNVGGAYVTFAFEGAQIEWYSEKKNTHGIAAVSIDAGPEQFVDLYSSNQEQTYVYNSGTLTQGAHVLKIRVTGTKNPASTGFYVLHDAFLVSTAIILPGAESDTTNTFDGVGAMENWGFIGSPQSGSARNTAFGHYAIHSSFQDGLNTGVGSSVLSSFQAGANTAVGTNALPSAFRAGYTTAVGYAALTSGVGMGFYSNTAIGSFALDVTSIGASNTAVGYHAGPVVGQIHGTTTIGANTKTSATGEFRFGNTDVTSIGGEVSWSTLSDGRFKKDIREDVSGLAFVNGLRPVSYAVDKKALRAFLGKAEISADEKARLNELPIRHTGFIAQEVDALVKKSKHVFPGVHMPENEKDPYSIRYDDFVVPLVKAVQELSALNEEQEKQMDHQQEQITQILTEAEKADNLSDASEISLLQNNPNPFSTNTEIEMVLPEKVVNAHIVVYNLEGRQLKEVQISKRGKASITIVGNELPAGMYIYALIADGETVDTKRMILTK
jgi:trimeric autotransporter adhesin